MFEVGQKIELLDIKALGLNYEYENGDIFIVDNVDDDGDANDCHRNYIKESHIQLGYARILPKELKPRDLACFNQVASVIGEDKAEQELAVVIGMQDVDKEADLSNAFPWWKSVQGYLFWEDIDEGRNPYKESRIDIIGQNGNDGEHYNELAEASKRIIERSLKEQIEFVAVSNESQQALDEVHGGKEWFSDLSKDEQDHLTDLLERYGMPPEGATHFDMTDCEYSSWAQLGEDGVIMLECTLGYWSSSGIKIDSHFVKLPKPPYYNPTDVAFTSEQEYTGGSVSYYKIKVGNPTTLPNAYEAECNDIIEALKMNYAEGNAFKAIWRKCAARLGSAKKGYTDGLYDSEKVVFFGERMVAQEKNLNQ